MPLFEQFLPFSRFPHGSVGWLWPRPVLAQNPVLAEQAKEDTKLADSTRVGHFTQAFGLKLKLG
jgi:hypothetical protein